MSYLHPRQTQNNGRAVLARLVFIKRTILEATANPQICVNATTLAREWECTTKTIHRDLEFLRDRLGHEIQYNPDRWSFHYTSEPRPVL